MTERIVVSGIGIVSPLGTDKETFFSKLCEGVSGIVPLHGFDTSRLGFTQGAPVSAEFAPREYISGKNLRKMDRLACLTAAASRLALMDAEALPQTLARRRLGIITGVAYGSTDTAAKVARVMFTTSARLVNPLLAPNTVLNAPAGHTAIELGLQGLNATVTQREASAEIALAWAAQHLQNGRADIILAGGADILSQPLLDVLAYFKAVSPQTSGPEGARPFDQQRNGLVLGEGAGMLCLETLTHARQRGANPYCELAGWGMAAAPAPPTDWPLTPTGPVLALQRALTSAGISAAQVDAVSASANGAINLDQLEADSLMQVFGTGPASPRIFSLKGALGESFSSGGIRAAALALSMRHSMLPPTLGLTRPLRPLQFVMGQARPKAITYGLVNGFAAGGTYACVVFKNGDVLTTGAK